MNSNTEINILSTQCRNITYILWVIHFLNWQFLYIKNRDFHYPNYYCCCDREQALHPTGHFSNLCLETETETPALKKYYFFFEIQSYRDMGERHCKGQFWARLKSGVRSFVWVFQVGGRNPNFSGDYPASRPWRPPRGWDDSVLPSQEPPETVWWSTSVYYKVSTTYTDWEKGRQKGIPKQSSYPPRTL